MCLVKMCHIQDAAIGCLVSHDSKFSKFYLALFPCLGKGEEIFFFLSWHSLEDAQLKLMLISDVKFKWALCSAWWLYLPLSLQETNPIHRNYVNKFLHLDHLTWKFCNFVKLLVNSNLNLYIVFLLFFPTYSIFLSPVTTLHPSALS